MKSALLILVIAGQAFAGSDGHHGSIVDLLPPFINVLLLSTFLVFKIKNPLKNYFAKKAEQVGQTLERASVKSKEAKALLEQQEKKIAGLNDEIKRIQEKAEQEALTFEKKHNQEVEEKKNKLKEDASARVAAEKKALLDEVNKKLIEKIILKTKESIGKNHDSQNKVSETLLKELH